ncbi:MAG: hypothetical protein ACK5VW_00925, partial [Holosporales bacterium]
MITRFEPRLRRVRVKVVELNRSENKLICTVSADMVMDQVHEPISFPLAVPASGGSGPSSV